MTEDWFQYDNGLRHERVKQKIIVNHTASRDNSLNVANRASKKFTEIKSWKILAGNLCIAKLELHTELWTSSEVTLLVSRRMDNAENLWWRC